jgi:hypothetical protein
MDYTINFSADALESKGTGSMDPVPAGSYNATVFDIKEEEVRSGPNEGKPRFNVHFRIAEGQYENRRVFSYVPLYAANDAWKAASFFKSLGFDIKAGKFKVPAVADLLGKPVGVRVKVGTDMNGQPRNEVGGFDKATSGADAIASMGATEVVGDVW